MEFLSFIFLALLFLAVYFTGTFAVKKVLQKNPEQLKDIIKTSVIEGLNPEKQTKSDRDIL